MSENCAKIEGLELDLSEIATKTAKSRQKPREVSINAMDSATLRSAMSLETWLSYAPHRPGDLPPGALQLFFTAGDVDFIDSLRAILIPTPTDVLRLVTVYIGKRHLARLIALHATGAYRRLHLTLGQCSFNTPSCTVAEAEAALKASGIPFSLTVVSHHAKFAVTDRVLLLHSANLNTNRRTENGILTADPSTVASFLDLADSHLHARVLFRRSSP